MLLLQKEGYGVEKGIPTLLMAAGSFDDILAITGFSTCLGMAFSTGTVVLYIASPFSICFGVVFSTGTIYMYKHTQHISVVWSVFPIHYSTFCCRDAMSV